MPARVRRGKPSRRMAAHAMQGLRFAALAEVDGFEDFLEFLANQIAQNRSFYHVVITFSFPRLNSEKKQVYLPLSCRISFSFRILDSFLRFPPLFKFEGFHAAGAGKLRCCIIRKSRCELTAFVQRDLFLVSLGDFRPIGS
jgi:hypothetical protein